MKNKSYFIFALLFIVLFCYCSNKAIVPSKDDFYGTWVADISIDDGIYQMRNTISDSTMKIESIITKTYEKEPFSREENWEIFGWKKSINKDKEKKIDFPNGFILRTKSDNGIKILHKIYISNDKNYFYFPAINDNLEQTVIFQRQ